MDFEYVKQRFNALDEKLQGLVELNNRLILENMKLHQRSQPERSEQRTTNEVCARTEFVRDGEAKPSNKVLEIFPHGGDIKVIGNTYLYRSILRENGGSWDKNISGWVFDNANLTQLVNALTEKEVEFKNHIETAKPFRSTPESVETAKPFRSTPESVEKQLASGMEFMEES